MPATPAFWPVALLLLSASVVYCLPLFDALDYWGRQDWDQFTFRYETPRLALLRDHVLPVWNPYANGGTVLLAHPNSPVLSPWYLIVLLLGAPLGLRVQVAFFVAVGAIGMAMLATRSGASRAGAIAGGIVFMMSSHFALHIAEGHMEWGVLGLMPWLAILVLRSEEKNGLRYSILGALLFASVVTFGSVYIPAVFVPFFTAWAVFRSVRQRRILPILRWGTLLVIAALLAAVKLLPMTAFTSDAPREVRLDQRTRPAVMATALLHPRQAYLYQAYRDRNLEDGDFGRAMPAADATPGVRFLESIRVDEGFHEYGNYIGVAGLLLAGIGLAGSMRRHWPLYAAGAVALVIASGASSPLDLWSAMRTLPLYGQLQVPARFGAAVVFVLAIAAALGLTALADRLRAPRIRRWRNAVTAVIVGALFVELALLGNALFRDVFVMPPVDLPAQDAFAHRYRDRFAPEVRDRGYDGVSQSAMYPQTRTNSGTLDAYENLARERGAILTPADSGYRGEAYLENGPGNAELESWTMSGATVRVSLESADIVVLNQNYYDGWRARRRDAAGRADEIPAIAVEGLIAVPVGPEHTAVELFYVPRRFAAGAGISLVTLMACLVVVLGRRDRPSSRSIPLV